MGQVNVHGVSSWDMSFPIFNNLHDIMEFIKYLSVNKR